MSSQKSKNSEKNTEPHPLQSMEELRLKMQKFFSKAAQQGWFLQVPSMENKSHNALGLERARIFAKKISVIIPAHNEELYIGNALHALAKQTFPRKDFEIIVVDNASD